MSEHFTRNTESIRCWCYTCNEMTEHAVSNGQIGRCEKDHTKKPDPRRANLPQFHTDEIYELHNVETSKNPHRREAIAEAIHLQALNGPNQRHDGKGNLPAKPEKARHRST